MGGCSAIGCSNHSRKGFRMFKYPEEKNRRRKWVLNCRRANWEPTRHSQICSAHFEENQFEQHRADGRKLLKNNSIPTIFNIKSPDSIKIRGISSKSWSKPVQTQEDFSQENFECVQFEQDGDNGRKKLQEKNEIPTNIIFLKSAESRESSTKIPTPLQTQDSLSQKNSFLMKRISELEAENKELQKENKKLQEEMKNKDECLKYLSELLKFSSAKSDKDEEI